jgi:hypothetical protein
MPPRPTFMEAGPQSIWISDQLQKLVHDVIVTNTGEIRAISFSDQIL